MKKLLAVLLLATLLLTLAACGDSGTPYVNYGSTLPGTGNGGTPSNPSNPSEPTNPSTPSDPSTPTEPTTEPITEPSTAPTTDPTNPTEPEIIVPDPIPVADPFINNTNYQNAPIGEVSIQPKYVYWEDGMLIAECFVCNGTDDIIYNINVKQLKFTGNTGLLADAAFGICTDLTLGSMKYEEWTFRFPADCVSQYGADLSSLNTVWGIAYSH